MIVLEVTATLRSPVHLGSRNTAAYFVQSFRHVPGRALLGAAAWAWIDGGGDPESDDFKRRFVSGAVSWGDLVPVPRHPKTHAPVNELPAVLPRSARTCKLFGLRHGVEDSLFWIDERRCAATSEGGACSAGLKRVEGAGAWVEGRWLEADPLREHRTHLAIGVATGTARPEYLYSRETLREGQVFRGQVHCEDDATAAALESELGDLPLSIGSGRSRGLGQVDVRVQRSTPATMTPEDIARCSDPLAGRARSVGLDVPDGARLFTLTAASPWALRGLDGAYARTLTEERLAMALAMDKKSVRILKGDVRAEPSSGWDGKAGLPTEVRQVIAAGSTFLCEASGLDDSALCDRLRPLVERGLGAHRVEGLGRIILNHPLHRGGAS